MRKKIAVLLLLAFILSTSNVNQVYARQKDNGKGVTADEVEDIIKNPDNYTDDTLSKREIKEFLNSKNENALIGKTEEEIAQYFATVGSNCGNTKTNHKGGECTNPVAYLHNTVGKKSDTYKIIDQKIIKGVGAHTCEQFGNGNNCTLTALYNLMVYYRDKKGYSKIPKVIFKVYYPIKNQATALGYTPDSGLPVWKNDDLVKNTWRKGFKYKTGNGTSDVFWEYRDFYNSIYADKPFMFSLASGYYFNHTVTVFGYKSYENSRTKKQYTFLMIRDGYTSAIRYLPVTGTDEGYIGCMTSIVAPKEKK